MEQVQKNKDPRALDISYIFCKQIFAPWENLDDDPIAIDLIYEQIINGRTAHRLACHRSINRRFVLFRYSSECLQL